MSPDHSNVTTEFETVHTMTGYYDGPRSGIANFRGRPHIYESLFQDAPDSSDVFLLQPIDEETFRLAVEDWTIWGRWERAFHSRQTTQDTHPALPEDRARHDELETVLKPRLHIEDARAFKVRGRFEVRTPAQPGLTCTTEMIVYWTPHENAA